LRQGSMHYGRERSLSSVDQACPDRENRLIYIYKLTDRHIA